MDWGRQWQIKSNRCMLPFPSDGRFLRAQLFLIHSYSFIYFWLCWIVAGAHRLSLVVASGGCSSLRCTGFSCWRAQALGMQASEAVGSRAWAQQLWLTGLVALRQVESSQTRDRTCVPCIGRWILIHCTTQGRPLFHSWSSSTQHRAWPRKIIQ